MVLRIYPSTVDKNWNLSLWLSTPHISFGRPIIAEFGVSTAIIAERWNAAEGISEFALDYGLSEEKSMK